MKKQFFSRPDFYMTHTGDLKHYVEIVEISGAPAFMTGIRAAFISDIHLTRQTTETHIQALMDSLKKINPDILLMGGDYADYFEDAERFYDALEAIVPKLGKFAVLGNNDVYKDLPPETTRIAMEKRDIRLLVNESVNISVAGGEICVAGVDEHLKGKPDARGLYADRASDNRYRILLSHFPCMPGVLPDLMLSGHTHGGQFNALGITPFTVGFERIMARHYSSVAIAGLHDMDGAALFVGKGIGASRLQWRIGVRPEIYEIRFVNSKA